MNLSNIKNLNKMCYKIKSKKSMSLALNYTAVAVLVLVVIIVIISIFSQGTGKAVKNIDVLGSSKIKEVPANLNVGRMRMVLLFLLESTFID